MEKLLIYIVEDDSWYANFLQYHLSLNPDYDTKVFESGKEILAEKVGRPNLITLDYTMPDIDGKELFKKLKNQYPDTPIIIVSGQEDLQTAVSLLKEGAYDYILKDDNTKERLWNSILHIKENKNLREEIRVLKQEISGKYDFQKTIIGDSPSMQKIFQLMSKATATSINVSITGETGTGKDVVAKAIHFNSERKNKPFVAVNVAAIPKDLLESELFGHEKGAFTGAQNKRIGKFEEANGGTLFLDEIGEMDISLQAKILRAIQEREVVRVGGNTPIKFNARIIVATHRNLSELVREGEFREDLYYRLMGLPIELPPLRDRGNDVLKLAQEFMKSFCKENAMEVKSFSGEARDKLLEYTFPGNIRELKSTIELSCVMSAGSEITKEDIRFNSVNTIGNFLERERSLKSYTKMIINHFLEKYDNNVLLVAKKLDVGKSTIYRMLQNEKMEELS